MWANIPDEKLPGVIATLKQRSELPDGGELKDLVAYLEQLRDEETRNHKIYERYRRTAAQNYGRAGELEFDSGEAVSLGLEGGGAYVMGWQWVPKDTLFPEVPDMTAVASSNIESVGYDVPLQQLYVRFKSSGVYRFSDVPPDVYERFLQAESQGRFFAAEVKDVYKTEKLTPVTAQAPPVV